MEIYFPAYPLKYQNVKQDIQEHCSKLDLLQLSHGMFCKSVALLAVAKGHHEWICSLAMAKPAMFLLDIPWESCSKFGFEQYSYVSSVQNIYKYGNEFS